MKPTHHFFLSAKQFKQLKQFVWGCIVLVLCCMPVSIYAQGTGSIDVPFTVDNTNDAGPGSLRAAIAAINAYPIPAVTLPHPNLILNFNIPTGNEVNEEYVIKLQSPLDVITVSGHASLRIDGTTQTNYNVATNPIIAIQPADNVFTIATGLEIKYTANFAGSVEGICIRNFNETGISIVNSDRSLEIKNNVINNIGQQTNPLAEKGYGLYITNIRGVDLANNYIGLNKSNLQRPCNVGVYFANGGSAIVEENTIAYNIKYGVVLDGSSLSPNNNPLVPLLITQNKIYGNQLKAIHLFGQYPPNNNIESPKNLTYNASTKTITGTSKYAYTRIEIFSGSGPQQAENFIAYLISSPVANANQLYEFSYTLPANFSAPYILVTATIHDGCTECIGYTSELSSITTVEVPCTGITIDKARIINLSAPADQAVIDATTGVLQFQVNSLPNDINGAGSLLVELYPEAADPLTGITGPDWSHPISVTLPEAASIGSHQINLNTLLPTGSNIARNYYWRAAIVYTDASSQGKKVWSDVRKFIVKPNEVAMPASDYLDNAHSNNINWVYTINYLDNGKTNEGIAYIDGLGKSRQMQSKVNSASRIMAVEAAYSEEGGSTVMTLPAPIQNGDFGARFGYAPRFFDVLDNGNLRDFSTQDFDREVKGTPNALMSPVAVDSTSGVGNYYSTANSDQYVDNALGYPYSYNVGGKSPLQRPVLSAAGAGNTFKITAGKEYKHFYDLPSNEELYKIYGSANAPQREKVSRSITFDPDGIGHVTYKDNENKLIATALTTCSNISSLKPLEEDGMSGLTVHINGLETDQTDITSMSKTASSKFLIPCGGTTVNIKHSIDLTAFITNGAPCLTCKYLVKVKIVNEANGEVVLDESKELVPATDLCANNGTGIEANKIIVDKSIVITNAGSYLVNRSIKPLTDPLTGENVITQTITQYLTTIKTNKSALFDQFKQKYNSEEAYFILRGKQFEKVTSTTHNQATGTVVNFERTGEVRAIAKDNNSNNFYTVGSHCIKQVNTAGLVTVYSGSEGSSGNADEASPQGSAARYNNPYDIVYRPLVGVGTDNYAASLVVADKGNSSIRLINIATKQVSTIATAANGINAPEGLCIDKYGIIYIASTGNNKVFKLNLATGTPVITQIAAGSSFSQPADVTADQAGNLYVAEKSGNRIIKIADPNNTAGITTIAGTGSSGTTDGPGASAQFNSPVSLSYRTGGYLLISDAGNKKVRVINLTSSNTVQTLTLSPGSTSLGTLGGLSYESGHIYLADIENGQVRNINLTIGGQTTGGGSTTITGWHADKVVLKDIVEGSYTKLVSGLDGIYITGTSFPESDQKLTSLGSPVVLNAGSIRDTFITTYKRMHGVDLSTSTDPIYGYTIGGGSTFTTTLPLLNELNIVNPVFEDGVNPSPCYLLKVKIPKACESQCEPKENLNCSTQCKEQGDYYLAQLADAYEELGQSVTVYQGSYSLTQLVDNFYPFNSDVFTTLTSTDTRLYENYQDKRLIAENFDATACALKCSNPNLLPSPCEVCQPAYANTVQDNINDLTTGYDYLIARWDAKNSFPFPYDSLMPFNSATPPVRMVNSDLQEKLGYQLHKYLSDSYLNNQQTQITVRADWETQGGIPCPNCQPAPYTVGTGEPACTMGPVRDISALPSKLVPLLILANTRAVDDYKACLAMNGSPVAQKEFLCAKDRDECLLTLDASATQAERDSCAAIYNTCKNNTDPNKLTSIDQQRKAMIQQVLRNLYSDPAQSNAFEAETSLLMNNIPPIGTKGLGLPQVAEFLDAYQSKRACVLSCQKSLEQSFNTWLEQQIKETINNIITSFTQNCFGKLNEKMDISYQQTAYHYTLYNYDKANRLVSTVPPEGVDYINLNDPAQYDAAGKVTLRSPAHRMQTNYSHNSLYTLAVSSPDEGETRYIYDIAGRLRFSQTAEQHKRSITSGYKIFSFITYDNETRVQTTGEYKDVTHSLCYWSDTYCQADNECSSCTGSKVTLQSKADDYSWPQSNTQDVVKIIYDTPAIASLGATTSSHPEATYTLQRVAAVWNEASGVQTHYSYDAHGRVKYVLQNLPSLVRSVNPKAGFKYTDYQYQNRTGRIDKIIYQKDSPQEYFEHRYTYDDDYRLITAEVSRNGNSYIPAAIYEYYLHGPLKRTGLGNKIQDIDYTYNINGWLKAINNPLGSSFYNDANESATDANAYAPDVFSEAVNYYAGDYKRGGVGLDASSLTAPQANTKLQSFVRNLYSGNISSTVSNTDFASTSMPTEQKQDNILAQGFNYDYLNRLTDVYSEIKAENFTAYTAGQYDAMHDNNYGTHIKYDANGNIKTLERYVTSKTTANGVNTYTPRAIDRLTYKYAEPITAYGNVKKKANNRLLQVLDAVDAIASGSDISSQPADNYTYDDKGRITGDKQSGISSIEWTSYDKVKTITKSWGSISFVYNAQQQRIAKNVTNTSTHISIITYYIYDANGVLMSTYEQTTNTQTQATTDKLLDFHTYGLSRLGTYAVNETLSTTPAAATTIADNERFELTDHLGSVRGVVTGIKNTAGKASIVSLTDYFEFGMPMISAAADSNAQGTCVTCGQLKTAYDNFITANGTYSNKEQTFTTYANQQFNISQSIEFYKEKLWNCNIINATLAFGPALQTAVTIPKSPQLDFGMGDFTIEAWVRYSGVNSQTIINNIKWVGDETKGVGLGLYNNKLYLWCGDGIGNFNTYMTQACATNPLPENTWMHIVAIRKGNSSANFKFYINGQLVISNQEVYFGPMTNGNVSSDYDWNIGYFRGKDTETDHRYLNGSIRDLKLYNRELTASEVQTNYTACRGTAGATNGLALYLPLNEGTGNVVYDHSSFGIIGNINQVNPQWAGETESTTCVVVSTQQAFCKDAVTENKCVTCGELKVVYTDFVTINGAYTDANSQAFATFANQRLTVVHSSDFYKTKLNECNITKSINLLTFNQATQTKITIPKSTQTDFGTGDFTFETWVKYSGGGYHTITFNLEPIGNNYNYKGSCLFIYEKQLYLLCADGVGDYATYATQACVTTPLIENTWLHIVAIRKGNNASTFKFYINGQFAPSTPKSALGTMSNGNVNANNNWLLGGANYYLSGNLHDIKFYNRELTQTEVKSNYITCPGTAGVTDGLVLYLPVNEGTSNIVHDVSTFGATGTITPANPQWITDNYRNSSCTNSQQVAFCESNANNICVDCAQLKIAYDDFITANNTYSEANAVAFAAFANQRFNVSHSAAFYIDKRKNCGIAAPLLTFATPLQTVVTIPKSPQLDFGTGDFSIDTWIKYSGSDAQQIIHNILNGIGNTVTGINLVISGKRLYLSCSGGTGNSPSSTIEASGSTTLPENQWVHIVAIRKGNLAANMKFYINGQLASTVPYPGAAGPLENGNVNSPAPWNIGLWINYLSLNGNIRDLKLYNRELTAQEVQYNYTACTGTTNVINGLGIFLPLNDGVGTIALDQSGNQIYASISSGNLKWAMETNPTTACYNATDKAFCENDPKTNVCISCSQLQTAYSAFKAINGYYTDATKESFATYANQFFLINHTADFYETQLKSCKIISSFKLLALSPYFPTKITVPKTTQPALGTGDFTIDTWVNYSSNTGEYQNVFNDMPNGSYTTKGINLYIVAWNLYLWCADGAGNSIRAYVPLPQNVWSHIVVVRKGNLPQNFKFYINGQLVPVNLIPSGYGGPLSNGDVSSTSNWLISCFEDWQYISGSIRDLKLYNRELSASEVQANYTTIPGTTSIVNGLLLFLPLNEGSGGLVQDMSPYHAQGTIYRPHWIIDRNEPAIAANSNQVAFCETDNNGGGGTVLYAGRAFNLGASRYGYQGSEQDGEITGHSGMDFYTTEYRMLDVRLGRWFSPDPITQPWQSPYSSMDNNPAALNDVFGLQTLGGPGKGYKNTGDAKDSRITVGKPGPTTPNTAVPYFNINNIYEPAFQKQNTACQADYELIIFKQFLVKLEKQLQQQYEVKKSYSIFGSDYNGSIRNSTEYEREAFPIAALLHDVSADALNGIGIGAIDVLTNSNSSVADKVMAAVNLGFAMPGKGKGKGVEGPTNPIEIGINGEVAHLAKINTTLVETSKSILMPEGNVIGTQLGKNPAIRTVTQTEAQSIVNRLITSGAKLDPQQPSNYKGIWYELPGGGGFGVRNVVSGKSSRLGSTGAIDINIPGVPIKNIKF